MWALLLLLFCADPAAESKTWRVLFADEKGGYWVDPETGATEHDPTLARKPAKAPPAPKADDGRRQLAEPPPPRRRYRDRTVSTANGVTVRVIKNRLQREANGRKSFLTKANHNSRPVVRPDGKAVAFLRWDGKSRLGGKAPVQDLLLLDLATNKTTPLLEKSVVSDFAWSPDGKRLVVGLMGKAVLLDAATGKVQHTWKLEEIDKRLWNHGPTGFVFHPDGEWIATRCTFLGGREAGTVIFGDTQLILLSTEKTRILDLPGTTCEGPIRGELHAVEARKER